MDKKQFAVVVDKLDKMLKLLARQAVGGMAREQDKIEVLDSLDFRPSEIAKMLNKSPENVSVVLSSIRKKKVPSPVKTVEQSATEQPSPEVSQEVVT